MKLNLVLTSMWRVIILILATFLSISIALASERYYTLMLEWPLDSSYNLQVTGDTQTGITNTPILQYHGQNRQNAFIVPALNTCQGKSSLQLQIDAPNPKQAATLTVFRERTQIYQQSINNALLTTLPELDPSLCQPRNDDVIGELTIAVAKAKSGATFNLINLVNFDIGHAWVEFRALSPEAPVAFATAGTYNSVVGDNVDTGINFFREIDRPADIRKMATLNRAQLNNFIALINQYVAAGTNTWTPWHNCTAFALDAWAAGTGEQLSATLVYDDAPWEVAQLGLPNSISLYYSILAAGGVAEK